MVALQRWSGIPWLALCIGLVIVAALELFSWRRSPCYVIGIPIPINSAPLQIVRHYSGGTTVTELIEAERCNEFIAFAIAAQRKSRHEEPESRVARLTVIEIFAPTPKLFPGSDPNEPRMEGVMEWALYQSIPIPDADMPVN